MNERPKFPAGKALLVANTLKALLAPLCDTIEICGSLRRKKLEVGDIELAFVPKLIQVADGLFDTKTVSRADVLIENWLAEKVIEKRLASNGRISSWGPANKHAVHCSTRIPIDFFAEYDIRDWPRTLVVRTGPKDFNVRLMSEAPRHGLNAHAYGEALHEILTGNRVFAKNERDFIELCGLLYSPPEQRL